MKKAFLLIFLSIFSFAKKVKPPKTEDIPIDTLVDAGITFEQYNNLMLTSGSVTGFMFMSFTIYVFTKVAGG